MLSLALGLHNTKADRGVFASRHRDPARALRNHAAVQRARRQRVGEPAQHKYRGTAGRYPRRMATWRELVLAHSMFPERVKATMLQRSITSIRALRRGARERGIFITDQQIADAIADKLEHGDQIWFRVLRGKGIVYSPFNGSVSKSSTSKRSRRFRKNLELA